jgi:hypothetical protein
MRRRNNFKAALLLLYFYFLMLGTFHYHVIELSLPGQVECRPHIESADYYQSGNLCYLNYISSSLFFNSFFNNETVSESNQEYLNHSVKSKTLQYLSAASLLRAPPGDIS